MDILFKNVTVFEPESTHHLKQVDLHIKEGKIVGFGEDIYSAEKVIEADDLWVSAGWFDMHAELTDPGFEHKEDTVSFTEASNAGGFTEVLCFAPEEGSFQSKNALEALTHRSEKLPVTLHAVANATINSEGKDLTEVLDLHYHGAKAFSDGDHSIQNADVLLKALQYLQITDSLLINKAEYKKLTDYGQMHEGKISTLLGLKGMPSLAEELNLSRDLEVLAFSGGRLHVPFVSTAASVQKIREAKAKGLNVTCGVATYQLAFTDEEIIPFDTNYKVNPPLRSSKDRKALIEGLLDGTIDVLVSGHKPQDVENKKLEFDQAAFGMINLETAFAAARTYCAELTIEVLLQKFVINPRKILKMPVPEIKVGNLANLTFFQPDKSWVYTEESIKSKSKNSPFIGKELKGKVVGIAMKNQIILNEISK
jgi:dihydroorotase